MRRIIIALAAAMAVTSAQAADNEIKIGVMVGFTGPIESLAPEYRGRRGTRHQGSQ